MWMDRKDGAGRIGGIDRSMAMALAGVSKSCSRDLQQLADGMQRAS
jgi:hypothetical protein